MTIEEAKKLKWEVEHDLSEKLKSFQIETGTTVQGIEIVKNEMDDFVCIELKIEL